jgi:hypothetical protein
MARTSPAVGPLAACCCVAVLLVAPSGCSVAAATGPAPAAKAPAAKAPAASAKAFKPTLSWCKEQPQCGWRVVLAGRVCCGRAGVSTPGVRVRVLRCSHQPSHAHHALQQYRQDGGVRAAHGQQLRAHDAQARPRVLGPIRANERPLELLSGQHDHLLQARRVQ